MLSTMTLWASSFRIMIAAAGTRILRLVFCTAFYLLLCVTPSLASAIPLTASVNERQGLPTISVGGGDAMSSAFVFWGEAWKWANLRTNFKITGPFKYVISGIDHALDFNLSGQINKPSDRQLVWHFDIDAATTKTDVIGGGIAFRFDLADFESLFGEPKLLPNNLGWTWGRPSGPQVEMRFDHPLAALYFERGQKRQIRALFYKGVVPQGRQHFVATLTLSDGGSIVPTVGEQFGSENHSTWPTNILNWPIAPWNISPVDLSFLNAPERPAGKHGFVHAEGSKLVFADGTSARFWGTNVTAYALFRTSRDNVKAQAHRLSELGFNLVRIHHIDSGWVRPNIFGGANVPDTEHLDKESLDKLDWWIKCLKDEGIYVWLDLEDGRQFKPADQIVHFDEISKGKPTGRLKGFNYVNESIQQAMLKFDEAYLNHLNPYTGLRYKDDPAIAAVMLTNENDLTHHFGNALLPNKHVPWHDHIYMADAADFAAKHDLPKNKVWTSWKPGPSKIFLNDLEHRFNLSMISQLRKFGVKVPIVTTSTWGRNPLSSLPALTNGNIIDVHSYGGVDELKKNPLYAPTFLDWIAAAQVVDTPLSVTEWNVSPFPVADRDTIPLYFASMASFQGWDALMQFAYAQGGLNGGGRPGNWTAFNDPALLATMPAAALLYRRGDVREADTTYVFAPPENVFFGQTISPNTSVALRTAAEKGKLLIAMPDTRELPWLKTSRIPPGAKVITDPNAALIDNGADQVVSDTGQLRRNWSQGIYTVDTPRTQAAMGWIGGKKIALKDVDIAITTRNATVAVQSLDNEPIAKSKSLMLSLGAQSVPSAHNRLPFHSQPVTGRLAIRAPKGLKLYKRDAATSHKTEIPATFRNGRYEIDLGPNLGSYWLFMH